MKTNRMQQSLLIAALGVLPVASAWAQPHADPDAPSRHSRTNERYTPASETDDERRDGDERRRSEGRVRRGPEMRGGDGEYGRPGPERRGPHREGPRRDGDYTGGDHRDGDHRMGPPLGRGGPGRDGHRGPRPGRVEDHHDRKAGEWRGNGRRGEHGRGEHGRHGRGRHGEWMDGRGGPRRAGRDGIGRYGSEWDGRWDRDRSGLWAEDERGGRQITLRGTVTSVVADKSIGVRADDGSSYWARVAETGHSDFKVGQRVELTGQWEDEFFVARNARPSK